MFKKILNFFFKEETETALERRMKLALLKTEAQLIKATLINAFFIQNKNSLTVETAGKIFTHIVSEVYPFFNDIEDKYILSILGGIVALHNELALVTKQGQQDRYEKILLISIIRAINSTQNNSLNIYSDDELYEKLRGVETLRIKM